MINSALKEKPETGKIDPPKVAVALDIAEKNRRSLIAIFEGYLGQNHAFNFHTNRQEGERVDPYGVNIFTFDPHSQILSRVTYRTLEDAVNTEIKSPNEKIKDIRNLLNQGHDFYFLINSIGGNKMIYNLFESIVNLVTSSGGKVSSYGTAEVSSLGALIFAEGRERHILPYSIVLLHKPSVLLLSRDGTIMEESSSEHEERLILKEREIISQIHGDILKEAFLKQFDSGQDTIIPGFLLINGNFATSYETIDAMKKDFYSSTGIKPYLESADLSLFWFQADRDYKECSRQFKDFMVETQKLYGRTDESPATPANAPVVQLNNEGGAKKTMQPLRKINIEKEQPPAVLAPSPAEKDPRSLVAILEGDLRKHKGEELTGAQLFTFDPRSQTYAKLSFSCLEDAVAREAKGVNDETLDIRKLLNQGPDFHILINSPGGGSVVIEFFDKVAKYVTGQGGNVLSYGTANLKSAAAMIWQNAQVRYVLPYSSAVWNMPVVKSDPKISLPMIFDFLEGTLKGELTDQERTLYTYTYTLYKDFLDTSILKFKSVIATVPSYKRKKLLDEFYAGDDVYIFGFDFINRGFAVPCKDVEHMKKIFESSLDVEPYGVKLTALDLFWERAKHDYLENMKLWSSEMEKINAETQAPREKVKENKYVHLISQSATQAAKGMAYAASIAFILGASYLFGDKVIYPLATNVGDISQVAQEGRITQHVLEKACEDSKSVSFKTGPQLFSYILEDGNVLKAEAAMDILGRHTVSLPSVHYTKECL